MRLARSLGGKHHAGTMSACGREQTPLDLPEPERGALGPLQRLARGKGLLRALGPRLQQAMVDLCGWLPHPLPSTFCAGRNYRAHAAGLTTSAFGNSLPKEGIWPSVFFEIEGPGAIENRFV